MRKDKIYELLHKLLDVFQTIILKLLDKINLPIILIIAIAMGLLSSDAALEWLKALVPDVNISG